MRATRRERYSPPSQCKTTLHRWDGIQDPPSFGLDLNGGSVGGGSAGKDHKVATQGLVLATYQLADWSDCIDDRCPCGVGHEALQRFNDAGARRLSRKGKQIWLPWLEPGDRGLQYLHQALIRQRNASSDCLIFSAKVARPFPPERTRK